jgi:acetyl esterase
MPLDPQAKAVMDLLASLPRDPDPSPAAARANAARGWQATQGPLADVAARDLSIAAPHGRLNLRLYRPHGAGELPLTMFFHSGGFVVGSLETHDALCRRLCAGANCAVLAVDYRLAPEHRFPAAPDDAFFATRWAAGAAGELGIDAKRIAVAGDSAGGCLAAATAIRARDESGPALCGLVMFYPVTDYHEPPTRSYLDFAEGFGLGRADMIGLWSAYLSDPSEAGHIHASPLKAELRDLPPAFVVTAEFDPLRDEGEAFARKIVAAGGQAVLTRYAGMNHGFVNNFGMIDAGRRAIDKACGWLRQRFAVAGSADATGSVMKREILT